MTKKKLVKLKKRAKLKKKQLNVRRNNSKHIKRKKK